MAVAIWMYKSFSTIAVINQELNKNESKQDLDIYVTMSQNDKARLKINEAYSITSLSLKFNVFIY